ncbi:MAG TPA: shikimate kinase [Acidothermaceae bacterium]|nr:shikimate kinase [Acidothermaceae bacterium]
MSAQRIVLIGMMGAGKTTIGLAISQRTGWPYIDNDEIVEQISGMPTRDLLQQRGEAAMREAEFAAVDKVLAMDTPVVAGAAAGVVLNDAVSARLRAGAFVVYLRATVETLVSRVQGTYRPWLGADPEDAMRKLYEGREPKYEALAHYIVDVDDGVPDQVAQQIVAAAGVAAV